MFKVRGVQVYPAQVDVALSGLPWLGSEYQLVLRRERGREHLLVRVESSAPDRREDVADALRRALGVRPEVQIVPPGSLPRTDRKTRRVVDERD
jgi:phenylacetate-CoA ligase